MGVPEAHQVSQGAQHQGHPGGADKSGRGLRDNGSHSELQGAGAHGLTVRGVSPPGKEHLEGYQKPTPASAEKATIVAF